jgi:hypothetical protein
MQTSESWQKVLAYTTGGDFHALHLDNEGVGG